MRIRTNATEDQLHAAARKAGKDVTPAMWPRPGIVPGSSSPTVRRIHGMSNTAGVRFARLDVKGSRTHDYGYNVTLSGSNTWQAYVGSQGSES